MPASKKPKKPTSAKATAGKKAVAKRKPASKKKPVAKKKPAAKKRPAAKKKATTKKKVSSEMRSVSLSVKKIKKANNLTHTALEFHPEVIREIPKKNVYAARSPHLIDLRSVLHDKETQKVKEERYVSYLQQQVGDNVRKKKDDLTATGKKIFSQLPRKKVEADPIFEYHTPQETQIFEVSLPRANMVPLDQPKVKKISKHSLPKVSAPKFTIPKISLPKFSLSTIASSKVSLPKVSLPKVAFPKIALPKIAFPKLSFNIPGVTPYAQRAVAAFVLTALVFVTPLAAFDAYQSLQNQKGRVLGITAQAVDHLKTSQQTAQLNDQIAAAYELTKAHELFVQARHELDGLNPLVQLIIKGLPQKDDEYQTAKNLLLIAELGTAIGDDIVRMFDKEQNDLSLTDKINNIVVTLREKRNDIKKIRSASAGINSSSIPENYRSQLDDMLGLLAPVSEHIDNIIAQSELLLSLLGHEQPKRYLLVFQNNAELRATGGFIGSLAEIDLNQGKMERMWVPEGGTYDLRGGLRVNIEPPKPISVLNPRWELQDANYFPDFEKSAEKILWFYRRSGQSSVDGLISVNATFLQQLLDLTGPVYMPSYGLTLTSENVLEELQYAVEDPRVQERGVPKQIIGELLKIVLEKLLSGDTATLLQTARIMESGLRDHELQLFFTDDKLQSKVREYSWAHQLSETDGDYLSIISTNIAGGKTDTYLEDKIAMDVAIQPDGSILNTITLRRSHNGQLNHPFNGVKNNDYIRFYVPLGSRLISADGFEPLDSKLMQRAPYLTDVDFDLALIESSKKKDEASGTETFQEGQHTVFANWIQTDVGETEEVTITYRLPMNLEELRADNNSKKNWMEFLKEEFFPPTEYDRYSLLLERQPGKINQTISVAITTPPNLQYVWAYPSQILPAPQIYTLNEYALNKDTLIGIIFTNHK